MRIVEPGCVIEKVPDSHLSKFFPWIIEREMRQKVRYTWLLIDDIGPDSGHNE